MEPIVEQLPLPPVYGTPTKVLAWAEVSTRMRDAEHYWVCATRPDGRPYVRPVDGIWHDDVLYFSGSRDAVWFRNLQQNPAVSIHLDDSMKAVVLDGEVVAKTPDAHLADLLAKASKQKYGWEGDMQAEMWTFAPARGVAWNLLFEDATRFRF